MDYAHTFLKVMLCQELQDLDWFVYTFAKLCKTLEQLLVFLLQGSLKCGLRIMLILLKGKCVRAIGSYTLMPNFEVGLLWDNCGDRALAC